MKIFLLGKSIIQQINIAFSKQKILTNIYNFHLVRILMMLQHLPAFKNTIRLIYTLFSK